GEGAVDDGSLAVAGEADAGALRAGLQAVAGEHHAGLHQLLVELAHFGQQLLAGQDAGFGILGGFDDDHETHGLLLVGGWLATRSRLCHPVERRRVKSTGDDSFFPDFGGRRQCPGSIRLAAAVNSLLEWRRRYPIAMSRQEHLMNETQPTVPIESKTSA